MTPKAIGITRQRSNSWSELRAAAAGGTGTSAAATETGSVNRYKRIKPKAGRPPENTRKIT